MTAARDSVNINDFALVAMLGVHGRGDKTALVPLPPAGGRAIDLSID